jgi:hypothetical protein
MVVEEDGMRGVVVTGDGEDKVGAVAVDDADVDEDTVVDVAGWAVTDDQLLTEARRLVTSALAAPASPTEGTKAGTGARVGELSVVSWPALDGDFTKPSDVPVPVACGGDVKCKAEEVEVFETKTDDRDGAVVAGTGTRLARDARMGFLLPPDDKRGSIDVSEGALPAAPAIAWACCCPLTLANDARARSMAALTESDVTFFTTGRDADSLMACKITETGAGNRSVPCCALNHPFFS